MPPVRCSTAVLDSAGDPAGDRRRHPVYGDTDEAAGDLHRALVRIELTLGA
jgi:hypothetical protein